jgi:Transposase DDE domain
MRSSTSKKQAHLAKKRARVATKRAHLAKKRAHLSKEPARVFRVAKKQSRMKPARVHALVEDVFAEDMHAARVRSLGNAVVGVMHAASLSVRAIGVGLAMANALKSKHAVKQVDRLLSNKGLDIDELFATWVPYVLGERKEATIALDWTDFDADDHAMLAAYLITTHGRATPLAWKTVKKSELKGARNFHEDALLERLHEVIPRDVKVTVLADRAFGDQEMYRSLHALGWDYVIRFRGCIEVCDEHDEAKPASDWLSASGRARMLKNVKVTQDRTPIPAVVLVHAPRMKEPWCLATSRSDLGAAAVIKLYGRRFTIEETFRDQKDPRFGLGLSATHTKSCARRDRILLLAALVEALLTLLGAAGEAAGFDRWLKTNTSKKRQHSLFNQGLLWYGLLPGLKDDEARVLMQHFDRMVAEQKVFHQAFGVL